MVDQKTSATILALADLAELMANQLEDGTPIEEVVQTLRSASTSVRAAMIPTVPNAPHDEIQVSA